MFYILRRASTSLPVSNYVKRILTSKETVNVYSFKCSSSDSKKDAEEPECHQKDDASVKGSNVSKYKIFKDFDSPVILDIDEERQMRLQNPEYFENIKKKRVDQFEGYNLTRGETGVFDVEELVDVLKQDNARDICVVKIPPTFKYVDYMVIVSGKSTKHMLAVAEFIRKLYKRKKNPHDPYPAIEGKTSKDWIAMDIGNIALHIFSHSARRKYDIESLWALGPEFDDLTNQKDDEYLELMKQFSSAAELDRLEPADTIEEIKSN